MVIASSLIFPGQPHSIKAFLNAGELVVYGETSRKFTNPKNKFAEDYISGRLG